jgi:hypothetical protein
VGTRSANSDERNRRSGRRREQPYFYVTRRPSWLRRHRLIALAAALAIVALGGWAWLNHRALLHLAGLVT